MRFWSVRDTARSWGISERLVQRLCAAGRIAGAQKISGAWMVPVDALKPADPRRVGGREDSARADEEPAEPGSAPVDLLGAEDILLPSGAEMAHGAGAQLFGRLMPLMNSAFESGSCRQVIDGFDDPGMRAVALAEYCYFSGRAEDAARISSELLAHADIAVRLSACLIYAYANLPLGNISRSRFALAELQAALRAVPSVSSAQSRAAIAFMGYTSSVLLHIPLPNDAPPTEGLLPLLPAGLRSFAIYVRAHGMYLAGDYARSLGMAEAALLLNAETYPIPDIYLHLVAVMDCMSLKRTDDARRHLLAAWELGRPDGLIEAFGEHHGLLGGMLESAIKNDWPEDFRRIIDITYRFSAGWRRVHNPATEETVADNLTTTEFAVSMLAARGWTNREIGQHLDISTNTVKSYLASAFRKLGIGKRQDLAKFMLR